MTTTKAKAKADDLDRWLAHEYRRDPGMEARVDALVSEMMLEQDLAALREARGLSQRDVAKRIGVSQPAVAKIESGRIKNIGVRTLTRYAAALGGQVRIQIVRTSKTGRVVPMRVRARG